MSDSSVIPGELSVNGRTWERYVYNDDTRYKWYRPMTDEEVQEHSNGLWDTVDDVDVSMASPPDYPRVEIELVCQASDTYEVTASRTRFGSGDMLMADSIGGVFWMETDDLSEAVGTVHTFAQKLS